MKVDFDAALLTSPERGGKKSAGGVRRGTQNTIWEIRGESVQTPLGFPRGCCRAQRIFQNNDCQWQSYPDSIAVAFSGSSEPMKVTDEGWRQLKYCLHFVQWYQLKIIADYFFSVQIHLPHEERLL